MKKTIVIIFSLTGFVTFGQENKLDRIKHQVESIKSDSTLIQTQFDLVELTGVTTDGGGVLKVWQNENQMFKILEEIGLSYGRVRTTIYLKNGLPIKIIETEENFRFKNGDLNYNELDEVFKANVFVLDWENDKSKIERTGKRVLSEDKCSVYEYQPIIELAKKAISD